MKTQEKILVGVAVAIAIVVGIPVALSAFGSPQSADAAVAQLNLDRKNVDRQTKRLAASTQHLESQVKALAWDESPDQLGQEMVQRLTAIAQASGMTLMTTRPVKPRPLDVMTEVSIEMHLTGVEPDLVKFLYPLQQPGIRLTVDQLKIAATNADTDLLDVDVTVSGYTLQGAAVKKPAAARRST